MISPKTYFLTEDRSKAVPQGDKAARFLLVREGQEIPDVIAEKYGITWKTPDSEPEPESEPEPHRKRHGRR